MHGLLLGRSVPSQAIAAVSEAFADHTLLTNIRPGALESIRLDRVSGYQVVLATAAHRFYAEPIARRLGISDVLATRAAYSEDGMMTNRLHGPNLYGFAKLEAVRCWLDDPALTKEPRLIRFYTDHVSDAGLLGVADEPFAVNPHGRLRRMALKRGWTILDWSKSTAVIAAKASTCAQ